MKPLGEEGKQIYTFCQRPTQHLAEKKNFLGSQKPKGQPTASARAAKEAGMSLHNELVINISEASSLAQSIYTTRLFHIKVPPHLQVLPEPQREPIQGHFQ